MAEVYAVFNYCNGFLTGRRLYSMLAAESYVKHNPGEIQWIEHITESEYLSSWATRLSELKKRLSV